MWEKIGDSQALAKKPVIMPEIEPELKAPVPRPMIWVYPKPSHRKITNALENLLINGAAVRGWITNYKTTSDREGTDHFVQYCFQSESGLIHGKNFRSFDDLHLAYGAPDYSSWMISCYKYNKTFTVIYNNEVPINHEIYGHLELYIDLDLIQISKKFESVKNQRELDELSGQFLRIALGPLKSNGIIWDKYLDLMKHMGLADKNDINDSGKNLQVIKNMLLKKSYSMNILTALSDLCREFIPGIWAAK